MTLRANIFTTPTGFHYAGIRHALIQCALKLCIIDKYTIDEPKMTKVRMRYNWARAPAPGRHLALDQASRTSPGGRCLPRSPKKRISRFPINGDLGTPKPRNLETPGHRQLSCSQSQKPNIFRYREHGSSEYRNVGIARRRNLEI